MLLLSNANVINNSQTTPYVLKVYHQDSTGKTMHSLTTGTPQASISNDHHQGVLKAAVALESHDKLGEISLKFEESTTSVSTQQLNHKWSLHKFQNITIIYSDTKNEGLYIEKDEEFPFDKLQCDVIDPPYLAERDCELILKRQGLSFSDLKKMPRATPEKIDLIVHERFAVNHLIRQSGKNAEDYFRSLLSSNEGEMRNMLREQKNTLKQNNPSISPSL